MNTGLTKLIFSDSFDPIVDVGINIVRDSKHFTKQASNVFGMDYSELKPDKDHVGIHLVALGDSEHYGGNRNGDLFPKKACIEYHDTFVKNANVFRHHKNQDKAKALGTVKVSAYNEPMGRIELFIHANKEKAAPELERLEKEGSIPFSMACRVPNDRCTICGALRKSASDPNQCSHVRDNLGDVFEDGKAVGTYNDEPTFFDISFVGRPADRIAWHLNKVATDQRIMSSVDLAVEHGIVTPSDIIPLTESGNRKYALCKSLAQYENMYEGLLKKASSHTFNERYYIELIKAADVKVADNDLEQLRDITPKKAFMKLAENGIILDVNSFFKFAFGPTYGELAPNMANIHNIIQNNMFNNLIKAGEYNRICNNSYFDVDTDNCFSYITGDKKINTFIKKLAGDMSILPNWVNRRVIEKTITGYKFDKKASAEINMSDNGISKISAELYSAYKLSALDGIIKFNPGIEKENVLALASVIC
ncbi:hypothetical protein ACFLQL_00140 [Verrucomicrobiota bacterium]